MPHRYNIALSRGLRPLPRIDFDEWADAHFSLPKEAAAEYGRYRTARTPMVIDILKALSPSSKTQVVVVIKPTQLAGTTVALIFLCGIAALYPGPTLFMQPTDAMVRSFSKKKLAPSVKLIEDLKGKISEPKSRDSKNTILQKDFDGGSWLLSGSNSGASFRSESIKYLVLDDFDGFMMDIEGEGSPEELADRRTGSFPGRKIYINSTTTVKDVSNIEAAFDKSSQGYFHVPCPHCGAMQYLEWGGSDLDYGIKFQRDDDGQVVDAWYQCRECHTRIDEHEKPAMMAAGRYVHKFPERKTRGFRYNALVTPLGWVNSWAYIAQKFLDAVVEMRRGAPQKYKTWLNSFMSEPYEEPGEVVDYGHLMARAEPYEIMTVPMGGLLLTAGVDTQDDRLEVAIKAYGRGEESWLIYHGKLLGDPEYQDVWSQLDLILNRTYTHASGQELRILAMGIDSGGHRTQAVYNYARTRSSMGVFALKGQSQPGKPALGRPTLQDVTWKGKKIENGVQLWPVGTEMIKGAMAARLKIGDPGPGYFHFPFGLDEEYYKQLTGEALVTTFKGGIAQKIWVQKRPRIEAWDLEIYCYAAAIKAGINRMSDEAWAQLERSIIGAAIRQEQQESGRGDYIPQKRPQVTVRSSFMGR